MPKILASYFISMLGLIKKSFINSRPWNSKAKFVKKTFLISKWLGLGLGFEIKKVFEQIYSIGRVKNFVGFLEPTFFCYNTVMKTLPKFIILFSIILPASSLAAGLDYASIYKLANEKIIIQNGALETKTYSLCQVANLSCQNIGSNELVATPTDDLEQKSILANLKTTYSEIWNSSRIQFPRPIAIWFI